MTIETWVILWKVVLLSCAGLYGLMTLVVSIGAIKDAIALHRHLRSRDSSQGPDGFTGTDSRS